jgi:hypothetical protein
MWKENASKTSTYMVFVTHPIIHILTTYLPLLPHTHTHARATCLKLSHQKATDINFKLVPFLNTTPHKHEQEAFLTQHNRTTWWEDLLISQITLSCDVRLHFFFFLLCRVLVNECTSMLLTYHKQSCGLRNPLNLSLQRADYLASSALQSNNFRRIWFILFLF